MNMRTIRSWFIGALLCCSFTQAIGAEKFPSKPIRMVVAQSPGSSADVIARIIATGLIETFKWNVIVENKPGANGIVGIDMVAKASPDGYTLGLVVPSLMTVNPHVYKNMPFKPLEDLVPITQTTSIIFALVVNPQLPFKNVSDLVSYAKKTEKPLNYSSAGVGNLGHLAAELLSLNANIKLTHIPNRGDTAGMLDVMGGHTDFMFVPLPSAISHIKSGKLNLLATASSQRVAQFSEVQTLVEQGFPDVLIQGWTGLVAPSATPVSIVNEIQRAVQQILLDNSIKQSISQLGFETVRSSSNEFRQFMKMESIKWGSLIVQSGLKLND
jgi:tripartite-type tricarboxylate transporter receptor subunit TctC